MANSQSPVLHVVIFPFMAQGHTIPLLDISRAFANRGLKVTIITTQANAPFISSKTNKHPNISLSIIPFPKVQELPHGCENTADLPSMALWTTFIEATKKMKQSFEDVLRHMIHDGFPPICVISDFFLEISELTNIPFTLNKCDIPEGLLDSDPNDPTLGILLELGEADVNSWGVIVNSFEEIEGDYVAALESFYCNEAKAYCVGPALLYDDQVDAEDHRSYSYIKWLDNQVGSWKCHPFIWVVRSRTWAPPNGWNERVKNKGLVLYDWVEQAKHTSTPCDRWVFESLWLELGVGRLGNGGLMVPQRGVGGEKIMNVDRGVICERVKELMGGEKGKEG
uniref:Uncharacterized protein n=1 Tax=Fagus sylvatica TaxID=28930 RepID=A0A2N9IE47_FAGSY